jgi:two-component system, cell cycle response regulator
VTNGNRVLLTGDASARPVGLERALSRAGFLLIEAPPVAGDLDPDAILVTLAGSSDLELRAAVAAGGPDSPPVVLVVAGTDPDAPAAALALGADDALAAPVHLPELCARLQARIRDRQYPRGTVREEAIRWGGDDALPRPRPSVPPVDQLLDHRLQEEFERARRYSLSFSLVLLDVGAREAEGGEGGLTAAAERLRQALRLPDFLSRYGGGELAIILPETGLDGARRSVVRLRERLARKALEVPSDHPSISAGIVTYPHPAVTQPDDMFALVEAALARGKAQVAGRVGVAD